MAEEKCPDCGSPNLEEDFDNDEYECRDCGWYGDTAEAKPKVEQP